MGALAVRIREPYLSIQGEALNNAPISFGCSDAAITHDHEAFDWQPDENCIPRSTDPRFSCEPQLREYEKSRPTRPAAGSAS